MKTTQTDIDTYLNGLTSANGLPFDSGDSDRCMILNGDARFLWPGCIFDVISLANGNADPATMTLPRTPLVLSSSNHSVPPQTIPAPTRSTVVAAMAEMEDYSGSTSLEYHEASSSSIQTIDFDLNVAAHGLMAEFESSVEINTGSSENLVAVSVAVTNFSLSLNSWNNPGKLIDDTVTLDQVKDAIGDGTAPAIISQLYFGRALVIVARTSSSSADFKAAIEATYDAAGVGGGSGSVNAEYQKILNDATMAAYETGTMGTTAPAGFKSVFHMVDLFYKDNSGGSIIGRQYSNHDNTPAAQPKGIEVGVSKIYVRAKDFESGNIKLFGHCRIKKETTLDEESTVEYQTLIDDVTDDPSGQSEYWEKTKLDKKDKWAELKEFKASGSPTYTLYSSAAGIYFTSYFWDYYSGSSNEKIGSSSSSTTNYDFVAGMGSGDKVKRESVKFTVSGDNGNDEVEVSFHPWIKAVT
ncbi:MAG: hypothetical protein ACJAYF_003514 [Arenicella sp.]|jgi:hypothetical protein